MKYDTLTSHISDFKRDDLIIQLSYLAWKAFDLDDIPDSERENFTMVQCFAPRVIAISGALGNNFAAKIPDNLDALNVCKLVVEVDDGVGDPELLEEEKKFTAEALQKSKALQNLGFNETHTLPVIPLLFLQRMMGSQIVPQASRLAPFFRSWEILKNLNQVTGGRVASVLIKILGLEAIDAYRSTFALFSMINGREQDFGRAFINIRKSNIQYNVENLYQISHHTLELVASRLSQPLGLLKDWHDEVMKVHPHYRTFYPLPFYERPLVTSDSLQTEVIGLSSEGTFMCPSPLLFMQGMSTFVFRLLIENKHHFDQNILTDMGHALESYLERTLANIFPTGQIIRVQDDTSRNADFIIELEEYILIIECKRNIDSSLSRTMAIGKHQVETWERIMSALVQCSNTKKNLHKWTPNTTKPILCVVLTESMPTGQEAFFAYIAQTCGALKQLEIEQFELLSIEDFEYQFTICDTTDVMEGVFKNWANYRDNTFINSFVPLSHLKLNPKYRPYRHLDKTFKELFPNLPNPFME
ncbi:hypothetical protein ACLVWU_14520 [Bdellovibrio sp. HCB290]|uniref:hypothetical protein n=1 Tax=Bdellovibrio sp. HCB290 TaxID=3394356 RepID=UPI0039B55E1E